MLLSYTELVTQEQGRRRGRTELINCPRLVFLFLYTYI